MKVGRGTFKYSKIECENPSEYESFHNAQCRQKQQMTQNTFEFIIIVPYEALDCGVKIFI